MRVTTYRNFCPHTEPSARARAFYNKIGITESFLRDITYSGPHEVAWAFLARRRVGRLFSQKLKTALESKGINFEIEERPKKLKRIAEKITRTTRPFGLMPSRLTGILLSPFISKPVVYPLGSVKDMYGIRVIIPADSTSRDRCYDILDEVLRVAKITDARDILALVDYLAYPQRRFDTDKSYLGRYESLHVSIYYLGVPIEIQIRDSQMDRDAKHTVKRHWAD